MQLQNRTVDSKYSSSLQKVGISKEIVKLIRNNDYARLQKYNIKNL